MLQERTETKETSDPPRAERPGARPDPRPGGCKPPTLGLGHAWTIREAAEAIGCSVSVVRYRLIPRGLPHFRASNQGKYLFYEEQVRAWILARQEEGGRMRRGTVQTRRGVVESVLRER